MTDRVSKHSIINQLTNPMLLEGRADSSATYEGISIL
jgi:hypothetical protein